MAQNIELDPKTGDYVIGTDGKPVETDSLRIPGYIRLKAKRKTWLYAPDDDWGSDFHLVKKRRTDQNPTLLENVGAAALQPIVDDGRASEVTVATTSVTRNAVGLKADITDASGKKTEPLVLPVVN